MKKLKLTKIEPKKSLNIKISASLDQRLKHARQVARDNNTMFNVSEYVEDFLDSLLKQAEDQLGIKKSGTKGIK